MDYFRRVIMQPEDVYNRYADDDTYVDKMQKILSAYPCVGVPREPSNIIATIFLGTQADAENIPLLKSYRINYILNCDGGSFIRFRRLRDLYGPETGIQGYEELAIEDRECFNIMSFFDKANLYLDYVRGHGGRVLIHCPAVSRSGAIAISYMIHNGNTLLEATRLIKDKRRVTLCNVGFMKQLVQYARKNGMLDYDVQGIDVPQYHTTFNRYRIRTAHLPPPTFY